MSRTLKLMTDVDATWHTIDHFLASAPQGMSSISQYGGRAVMKHHE